MEPQINEQQIQHEIWLKCMQMNQCNQQQAIQFVSKCKKYINCTLTQTGQTLLMIACSIGSKPIVISCLQNGSDVNIKDTAGRTALHYCAAIGNLQIFELLISKGNSPLEQTIGGQTPLTKACLFSQGDIIEWYLNNCLQAFQIEDKCGKKPLQILKLSGQDLYQQVRDVYNEVRMG